MPRVAAGSHEVVPQDVPVPESRGVLPTGRDHDGARSSRPADLLVEVDSLARARVAAHGDDAATRRLAEQMGYLDVDGSDTYAARLLDMIKLISEPVISGGVYDFGGSDLFARGRDAGLSMFFEDMSEYRIPPPETMFLHRKLVGSFMLCSRIGARVNVQELILPFLPVA